MGSSVNLRWITFAVFFNVLVSQIACSSISSKFSEYGLVPEFVPSAPTELLQVTYPNYKANLGNLILPSAVHTPPTLQWKADPKRFYLLTMIDPDFPGIGIPQYFHWVIGNIPGDDLTKGELLASYVRPQPSPGGPHRYTFLIFEQPKKLNYTINLFLLFFREHPSLRLALLLYGINPNPLAGNFFLSEKQSN